MSIFVIKLLQYLKCRGNINVQKEKEEEKSVVSRTLEFKYSCTLRGKSALLWKGEVGWVVAVLGMKSNK